MCPILGNGHGRIAGENRSRKPLLIVVSANYVVADANTTRLSKNLNPKKAKKVLVLLKNHLQDMSPCVIELSSRK